MTGRPLTTRRLVFEALGLACACGAMASMWAIYIMGASGLVLAVHLNDYGEFWPEVALLGFGTAWLASRFARLARQ